MHIVDLAEATGAVDGVHVRCVEVEPEASATWEIDAESVPPQSPLDRGQFGLCASNPDGSELTVWIEAAALPSIMDAAIVALRARGLHPQALCPTGACETCCPTEAADNT